MQKKQIISELFSHQTRLKVYSIVISFNHTFEKDLLSYIIIVLTGLCHLKVLVSHTPRLTSRHYWCISSESIAYPIDGER